MRRVICIGTCLWTLLVLASTLATAQVPTYQYAVKFVCGVPPDDQAVAPGKYFTAINIHNPSLEAVKFSAKVAVALPGEKPGSVSKFIGSGLGPDEALEIDCQHIMARARLEETPRFLKGFFVINTRGIQLDVVAVYTAAGSTKSVETMQVERVSPRTQRPRQ